MTTRKWLERNTKSLRGKRIAVTGSTGGLGVELCAYLASLGASLVLLERSEERSQAHRDRLCARFANVSVTCIPLDLESLDSAAQAVERLTELEIDVFIHNAGAYGIPRHRCESGYDNLFQINFATPYYMICRLLPLLRARGGHVVAVGSVAYRYSETDESDVDFSRRKAVSKAYGNAKRYLTFALHELFAGESDVSLSVVHPGLTVTNITAHYPKPLYALIKQPMKWIFMKPARASLSLLYGVFVKTPYGEWIGPARFDVWGTPRRRTLRGCSPEERARIAKTAEEVLARCVRTADAQSQL